MSILRLLAIAAITLATAAAWFILGTAIRIRTADTSGRLGGAVSGNWGPQLFQTHPVLSYEMPGTVGLSRQFPPEASEVSVKLLHQPKRKGLIWHRTYALDFSALYQVRNPTPIAQTIFVSFRLPAGGARYDRFQLRFGEKLTDRAPVGGEIRESLHIGPGATVPLAVSFSGTGTDRWTYDFQGAARVRGFHLAMTTDFEEIDIPAGSESPSARQRQGSGWLLDWNYDDVLGARAIAMDMPAVANPGAIAGRITYFAPVSLLFFFAVLVMVSVKRRVNLHPMNYFFLAAGCFAFQLLFAYLVDLLPLLPAFLISAVVSLVLVNGYLLRTAGAAFARISALAQTAYMVLFSYSFFFDGLTGLVITAGAIITLAILMFFTAGIDWSQSFRREGKTSSVPSLPTT
ncbi:MAG: inner membrane CreD family protein [Verrucomicrobiota bacterium]